MAEDAPTEMVKLLGKDLPTEATTPIEPVTDLNSVFFSATLEDGLNDPARFLKREVVSANPEPEDNDSVIDLKKEDLPATPEFILNDPVRDLTRDICLPKLVAVVIAEVMDRKKEDFSAKLEP